MFSYFFSQLRREWLMQTAHPIRLGIPPMFFVLVASVFAIAAGGGESDLSEVAPAIVCVSILLGALLTQAAIFSVDDKSGYLEQLLISAQSLTLFIFAKVIMHWLLTGGALILTMPIVALLLHVPQAAAAALLLTIPLVTFLLSLLVIFAAALTVGRYNALLTVLLVIPFSIPLLIFVMIIVDLTLQALPIVAPFSLLLALFFFFVTILPIASAAVLRMAKTS